MKHEALEQVEELAALQFAVREVAIIMDETEGQLAEGEGFRAYLRGRLRAQADVRRSILSMAKQGSAQAHKQFMDLADKSAPVIEPAIDDEPTAKED